MVNALKVSELTVPHNLTIRRLVNRVAPGAAARFEDGMIAVSVPLPDWAGTRGARS